MLITSFIPLWISILFVVFADNRQTDGSTLRAIVENGNIQTYFSLILVCVVLFSTTCVVLFLLSSCKQNRISGVGKITHARKSTTLATDFLLTYIMPLIAFDFTRNRDIALFLIYFALIAFLNIRNGNVYTNILFEVMGYKIFSCDIERKVAGKKYDVPSCVIISKKDLVGQVGQDFSYFDFNNDTYLHLQTPKEKR